MMKKIFIKKLINVFAALSLLLTVLSCSNSVKTEENKEGFVLRLKVTDVLTESAAEKARTIKPDFSLNTLTDIVLKGAKVGDEQKTIAEFDSISDLEAAELVIPFKASTEVWNFTLIAQKDSNVFSASCQKQLSLEQTNTLNFKLELQVLTGYGDLDVFIYGPEPILGEADKGRVTDVKIILKELDGTPVYDKDGSQCGPYVYTASEPHPHPTPTGIIIGRPIDIKNIPAGRYRLIAYFNFDGWDTGLEVAYWQDTVWITEGTWLAEIELESVMKAYKLNYHLLAEGEAEDDSLSFTPASTAVYAGNPNYNPVTIVYTESEDCIPTRDNYIFTGWYTDESFTNPLSFPLEEDTDLYAKWESLVTPTDKSYFPASVDNVAELIQNFNDSDKGNSPANPAVIRLLGKIDYTIINSISTALQANSNYYFSIDFTRSLGLNYITYQGFQNCKNLVEVILADEMYAIYDLAFENCSNLTKISLGAKVYMIGTKAFYNTNLQTIELSDANENCILENNVLYTKDMSELMLYPIVSPATSFEIPEEVSVIRYGVFLGTNLTSVSCEDTESYWYRGGIDNDIGYIMRKNTRCTSLSLEDLANDDRDNIVKVKKADYESYMQRFFGDISSMEPLRVYEGESTDLSDYEFSIVDTPEKTYKFYKLTATPGSQYTINFCTNSTNSIFDGVEEIFDDVDYLTNPDIYIFNSLGKEEKVLYYYDNNTSFTASDTEYYIAVYNEYEFSRCAFRVWEHPVSTDFNISITGSEIEVEATESTESGNKVFNFAVKDEPGNGEYKYDDYTWYLDDDEISAPERCVLEIPEANLDSGVHTLMLIVKKGKSYYSYTAQIWKD